MTMYAPSTPEIAPEAPSDGMIEFGSTKTWASDPTRPASR
jgi:hypothetical protein